ncbi:MAG: phosphate starvation-inducible protein PhoH [Gammaproteobacteria bacterium]|nr:MAG: phosphate starvation-inducible protein PhoH [Gammaproteobacteria bacterium]TND06302.1 MAG: phosphate starvation-inducible protein PhoH [Gammaproteobacteria bacterium]
MSTSVKSLRKKLLNTHLKSSDVILEPADNKRLANLCGQFDENLRMLERRLGVEINNRDNVFRVIGDAAPVLAAEETLRNLYGETARAALTPSRIHLLLKEAGFGPEPVLTESPVKNDDLGVMGRRGQIKALGPNQARYLKNVGSHDISFGVGPAGTGKTYLAVACAVEALEREQVRRLLLVRPAVEAGERLGFLPGDFAQKIDPYLRPLYDALHEMLGFERVAKLVERNVIEIAPLAYMRGRTLNEAFIILDEAQNTTIEQMKMFLTRIGFGSTVVVTGDVTQTDLPREKRSGLRHAIEVLKDVDGISFTFFQAKDVVRHPLVQRIVTAYEAFESSPDKRGYSGNE